MNVSKLCNFLEGTNHALFISDYAESDRWLEDAGAVMFVNNANVLMQIAGNGQQKEPVPWESAREAVSKVLRKHPIGWVTMAAFPPVGAPNQSLIIGAQHACHDVGGAQSPLLLAVVALATFAAFIFLIRSSASK